MTFPSSETDVSDLPVWRTRAFVDAMWILAFAGSFLFLAIQAEAFTYVADFSEAHERWEIDEILTTLMVLPIALVIYALRRLYDVRSELHKRKAAELMASKMALHDALTGLPNRRKADAEITRALRSAAREPVTLMSLDLNRFKPVNDLYGHTIGDELLLCVGGRLTKAAGPGATVCRLGGDEFCILLPNSPPEDALLARVEAISSAFDDVFLLTAGAVNTGAAIGITTTDNPEMTADTLMAQADEAMYRAKAAGRNGFRFFETGMEVAALRRATIESELRTALVEDRIEAHFQPLVRLGDGAVIGFEALARWRLPDNSYRQPLEFIGIAEESGLISDVFFAVLTHAARAAKTWPPEQRFSINLSPVQFNDPWLAERILKTLLNEGISPGRLEIEVTESSLVMDYELARNVLWSLRNQGIHVALDDFGTGYSSLRHLSELPFETLKIDKSYVRNLGQDPAADTIVRTVTSMAHNLGLRVTAEGVETQESAASLAEIGCDIGQGFLYGEPEAGARTGGRDAAQPEAEETPAEDEAPQNLRRTV